VAIEGPLHSPPVRPSTPIPPPPEPDPHPHAVVAAPYDAAPGQYQADTDDPVGDMSHTDAADTHQNDDVEAPHNKADSVPADTPHNEADDDVASGPLSATHPHVMMN